MLSFARARIGVLLSGCGAEDGSDPQETVLLYLSLARRGLRPVPIAPDRAQETVVDHSSASVDERASRNSLVEAARLTRGPVRPAGEAAVADLDALIIPGGAGAVRTLCPGAAIGGGPALPEVLAMVRSLRARGAPLGAIGLGEVVLARCEGRPLREDAVSLPAGEAVRDGSTVFTPGFLASGSILEVGEGIESLVAAIEGLLRPSRAGTAP